MRAHLVRYVNAEVKSDVSVKELTEVCWSNVFIVQDIAVKYFTYYMYNLRCKTESSQWILLE